MGKTKIVILDEKQKAALEKGWRESDNHTFRQRCQLILLKSEGRISTDIAEILWRKLKYEWLSPADYLDWENSKYQTRLILSAVGSILKINYRTFACKKTLLQTKDLIGLLRLVNG